MKTGNSALTVVLLRDLETKKKWLITVVVQAVSAKLYSERNKEGIV